MLTEPVGQKPALLHTWDQPAIVELPVAQGEQIASDMVVHGLLVYIPIPHVVQLFACIQPAAHCTIEKDHPLLLETKVSEQYVPGFQ